MPLYEYDCGTCGQRFSLIQAVGTTEKDTLCPECGSAEVKRLISAFSFGASSGGGFSAPSASSGGG